MEELLEPAPAAPSSPPPSLAAAYPRDPGSPWDELYPPGATAPAGPWQPLLRVLDELGPKELARRHDAAARVVAENGVTYNVYNDPEGPRGPWRLDTVPFALSAAEWEKIEEGLAQRARLLEAVLADIYGPQHLLQSGAVPAELVYGHPGYLRPLRHVRPPMDRRLVNYAADLCRGPGGVWWVMSDRTQAPSGSGYVLENRLAMTRAVPELFRSLAVQRIASHYAALRDTLRGLAPHNRDNPRIVLLTPGPYNETYFEHSFLARYLGYTLVEGTDLTVRDNRVYLKTLEGLHPVDVILRRLDDSFCDPLELRADSAIGIPGLVQAVRANNVAIANPLGAGVVENPGFLAFLPALCRETLGEELLMPSTATWWCGQEKERKHVLDKMEELVIKPIARAGQMQAIFGDRLSKEQRAELRARIEDRPWAWVGQERVTFSTTPCWDGSGLSPRHAQVRAYAVAHDGDFRLMPGGMTRVASSARSLIVSMQHGGRSKDTIVLSDGPAATPSLMPPEGARVELRRGGRDLLSRVVDNMFWLGRYVERADGLARLLRGCLLCVVEETDAKELPEMSTLLRVFADQGYIQEHHVEKWTKAQPAAASQVLAGLPSAPPKAPLELEREILALVADPERPNSLRSLASNLHRIAWLVRDRMSMDSWRILTRVEEQFASREGEAATLRPEQGLALLNDMILTFAAFGGLSMESMTRGQGWRFLDMGRRLERALNTASLLRAALGERSPAEARVLTTMLGVADSAMTYRARYLANMSAEAALDLLLTDESNPRSIAFQIAALDAHVAQLPREHASPRRAPTERHILSALTSTRLSDVEVLCRAHHDGRRTALLNLLNRLGQDLRLFSDAVGQAYFSHLAAARPVDAVAATGGSPL